MFIYNHRITKKPFIEISRLSPEEGLFITPDSGSIKPRLINKPYVDFYDSPKRYTVKDFNSLKEQIEEQINYYIKIKKRFYKEFIRESFSSISELSEEERQELKDHDYFFCFHISGVEALIKKGITENDLNNFVDLD